MDGATANETKMKVRTRCWDVLLSPDGEGDGDFVDEDERVVP